MKHCCSEMKRQVEYICDQCVDRNSCPDCLIDYRDIFDDYSLLIHDGGSSRILISFCPFCGEKLPDSKFDEWWEKLDKLLDNFEGLTDVRIPEQYLSSAWRKKESKTN